jgi:hypothetical protein
MYNYLKCNGLIMKIPCARPLPFVVYGLSFLEFALTNIQYQNLILIATALILGAKFNLTEISRMWIKEKSVSALSEFLSDAKISTYEMQQLYQLRVLHLYKPQKGYFIVDDTMKHHTKFCKWIHGVSVIFDHAVGTNLKATCIVFLYYNDGDRRKHFIDFRIFYKEDNKMPWYRVLISILNKPLISNYFEPHENFSNYLTRTGLPGPGVHLEVHLISLGSNRCFDKFKISFSDLL